MIPNEKRKPFYMIVQSRPEANQTEIIDTLDDTSDEKDAYKELREFASKKRNIRYHLLKAEIIGESAFYTTYYPYPPPNEMEIINPEIRDPQ